MSLRQRVEAANRRLPPRDMKVDPANCVCKDIVIGYSGKAKELEAELNGTCPVHGFRLVNGIVYVTYDNRPTDSGSEREETSPEEAELRRVIEQYEARKLDWTRQRRLSRDVGQDRAFPKLIPIDDRQRIGLFSCDDALAPSSF